MKNISIDYAVSRVHTLASDLKAIILLPDEKGHIHPPMPGSLNNSKPDTEKRENARTKLQKIYDSAEMPYIARYEAGKALGIDGKILNEQAGSWMEDAPLEDLKRFYNPLQPDEMRIKAGRLLGFDNIDEGTDLNDAVKHVWRLEAASLHAKIVLQEEQGHVEEVEVYPGSRYGTYDCWDVENVWVVDAPRITKPDYEKRKAAKLELLKIYDFSKWRNARYFAAKALGMQARFKANEKKGTFVPN